MRLFMNNLAPAESSGRAPAHTVGLQPHAANRAAHAGRAHAPTGRAGRSPQRRAHPKGPQGVSENRKKSVLSRGVRAVKGASVDVRL